jgi:hypothetical protein
MTDPNTQTFRLLDPLGQEIMAGPMSMIMENIPDTNARNSALEQAVHAAKVAVEAEERLQDARTCAAQMISDTVAHLASRLDAYITRREEQRRQDEEQAEREEQRRIEDELASLPDPDAPDPLAASGDDDQLTVHPPVDPERYGPGPEIEDDQEQSKPVLSYGRVPLSYIKKKDATGDLPEGVESRAPAPLGSQPVYDPAELGKPEDPKQVEQPISSGLW